MVIRSPKIYQLVRDGDVAAVGVRLRLRDGSRTLDGRRRGGEVSLDVPTVLVGPVPGHLGQDLGQERSSLDGDLDSLQRVKLSLCQG